MTKCEVEGCENETPFPFAKLCRVHFAKNRDAERAAAAEAKPPAQAPPAATASFNEEIVKRSCALHATIETLQFLPPSERESVGKLTAAFAAIHATCLACLEGKKNA